MNRKQQNISFLLVLILVFPLVYQSVHVVVHHYFSSGQHCHFHLTSNTTTKSFSVQNIDDEGPCPICRYEFAAFKMPNIETKNNTSGNFISVDFPLNSFYQNSFPGFSISLRAPPVLV
jgi:hypothetical protein